MRESIVTVIDHTASWGDRRREDVFPAIYRQYQAPASVHDCQTKIKALKWEAQDVRSQREKLLPTTPFGETDKAVKALRTRLNKLSAAKRAYIHWLALEEGEEPPERIEGTQLSTDAKLAEIARSLKDIAAVLREDLKGAKTEADLEEELRVIQQRLEVAFV